MKKTFFISALVAAAFVVPAFASQYLIKKGDTLSEIGRDHNHTVSRLMEINPQVKDKNLIYTGKYLNLDDNGGAKSAVAATTAGAATAAAAATSQDKTADTKSTDKKTSEETSTAKSESENNTGFYVAGRVGAGLLDNRVSSPDMHLDGVDVLMRAAIGWNFDPIRVEAEYGYMPGAAFDVNGTRLETQINTVMGNIFYDIDLGTSVTPFVNVGAGYVRIRETSAVPGATAGRENNTALSAGAGMSWDFSETLKGELAYRFSDFGHIHDGAEKQSIDMHEVTFGLRYQF